MGLLKAVWALLPRKRQRHIRLQSHDDDSDHHHRHRHASHRLPQHHHHHHHDEHNDDAILMNVGSNHDMRADATAHMSHALPIDGSNGNSTASSATIRARTTSTVAAPPGDHPEAVCTCSANPALTKDRAGHQACAACAQDHVHVMGGADSGAVVGAAPLPASASNGPGLTTAASLSKAAASATTTAAAAVMSALPGAGASLSSSSTSASARKRKSSRRTSSSSAASTCAGAVSACCSGFGRWLSRRLRCRMMTNPDKMTSQSYVNYITVVIFLEFFAWGLVTTILPEAFADFFGPESKWMVLGLTQGLKGFLSFLSAPVLGALSDTSGRKRFLLLAVGATCLPLPFLLIANLWWHVLVVAFSGVFAVTFSIVFAYVSDVTNEEERSAAFGQVSATFAASLVISPALGSLLQSLYGVHFVCAVSTIIAAIDVLFIALFVPESVPPSEVQKKTFSWQIASPFSSLKVVFSNVYMLKWSVIVFFSYLPEAGQYQCLMLYLQSIGFSKPDLAGFIAGVGILSILAQTYVLSTMSHSMSQKSVIIAGLIAQACQLALYGVVTTKWALFMTGGLLAFSSLNYPAVSALLSQTAAPGQQGAVQGMVTGIRSLCTGLGPAVFGALFQYTEVPLDQEGGNRPLVPFPGSPFLIGCVSVFVALFVSMSVPDRKRHDGRMYSLTDDTQQHVFNASFVADTSDVELKAEGDGSRIEDDDAHAHTRKLEMR
ncbi:hypothetical protein PTSG_04322 [Salpingoeca rosetta]|uniref:Major facilitator superfamily (MFS) profile domain-containing protein n=1 Tax=Salpingoeca rosetta (strain ATCC 50818 / BSB-021) TaxID=946362 RepID=F2U879_SALR5|nr:uncharacterized protein PTSG_04322 [Salpingoeca rosetta]EGD72587.1 hypothetical protein PTSG_04322 [Salpingoeca rosetta]|eukprot:XP_004994410.1 hypothetical protein PTSG_04322 [Salpingoeca rosetta]